MSGQAFVEVLSTGLANTVQDLGRPGFLDAGVGHGGAMDRPALTIANALAGNPAGAAGIEVALFPFRLRFLADAAFAATGAPGPAWLDEVALPPWWRARAKAGQVLRLDPPREGARAYLAIGGGIDVPLVLGSRSTDLKGRFGGLEGRGLRRGDLLPVGLRSPAARLAEFGVEPPWWGTPETRGALRVLPAAEFERFTPGAREDSLSSNWTVSAQADRQGVRLDGPALRLEAALPLFSHGIVPGTVQVPADGRPIIQLSDANTAGGYPKIATVIEADLWKLGQAPVGARLRFKLVGRDAAVQAWRDLLEAVARTVGQAALARNG